MDYPNKDNYMEMQSDEPKSFEESRSARQSNDPELGSVPEERRPSLWARYVSLFFSPLLIPTYAIVLALWVTPLSLLAENTRFGVSIVILLVTGMIPTAYKLTLARFYFTPRHSLLMRRCVMAVIMAVCQCICGYYLYRLHAPEWMVMIMVAFAAVSVACALSSLCLKVSGHMAAMGALVSIICYFGRNGIMDVAVTPWAIGLIILSGLVASSRMEFGESVGRCIVPSFFGAALVAYGVMCVHFFEALY